MISKLKTFSRIYKNTGLTGIFVTFISKIFPPNNPFLAWDNRYLFKYVLENKSKTLETTNEFTVTKLTNIETLKLIGINGMSKTTIEHALKDEQKCWVIYNRNNLAGYVWISNLKEKIHSDTGYLYPNKYHQKSYWWRDLYVIPKYRGKGVVQILHMAWLNHFDHSSRASLYTEISPNNIASLKIHEKLGFINFCYLKMWCVLGLRIYLLKNDLATSIKFRYYPGRFY